MRLVLATDLYQIARPLPGLADGRSVIAGYPWFGDWGRDTMISLPGLCLATGRFETARLILETFARFVDRGMLPNVFPGAGATPDYNTADASLWYIEAWRAYVEATGDEAALRRVFPVLAEIVAWHLDGTRYGIGVDPADGLLRAGEPGVQLTWMDARVGDRVVTPRIGKPVEINALWYNALDRDGGDGPRRSACRTSAIAPRRKVHGKALPASRCRTGDGLYDVIDGPDGPDASLRPNQIFAVSLPGEPARPGRAARGAAALRRRALDLVRSALAGAAGDAAYRGACRGGVRRARRRLSPGHGVGLAARAMGARPLPGPRRRRRGAALSGADRRSSGRRRARPGQRDLRRRPAAHAARLPGASLVGRLRARSLVAPRTGEIRGRVAPSRPHALLIRAPRALS